MNDVLTPSQIERELYELSKDVEGVQRTIEIVEKDYADTKAEYEIALARTRLYYAGRSRPDGKNYTTQERDDLAIVENKELHFHLAAIEATARATRAKAKSIELQVEILRSRSASVRSEMKLQ